VNVDEGTGYAELSDVLFGFFRQMPRCCTHMPQQIPLTGIYLFIFYLTSLYYIASGGEILNEL
jgi:hypothetical protein